MKTLQNITLFLLLLILNSCSNTYYNRNSFKFPIPVDTRNKQIEFQLKKQYDIGTIHADNMFDGARMNDFKKISDDKYEVLVKPENTPINNSAWYAFRIWSDTISKVFLKIRYVNGTHRYSPKYSFDRKKWAAFDPNIINKAEDGNYITFPLTLTKKKIWIAAQEIINSSDVKFWIDSLKVNPRVSEVMSIGKSTLGRDIPFFRIGNGSSKGKKAIVLMSRQHPPETTGFIALKSFIDELLITNTLSEDFFNSFDIWVFPLLNPDGVDLGHWRHNANGVDLNRDWAYYRQKEIDVTTKFIVDKAKVNRNKVLLGLDFHSTQKDIYYTYNNSFHTKLRLFTKYWTESIDRLVYPFSTIYSPEPLSKPYSKTWFYMQFKAESLTYEVGDNTPNDIINHKAKVAAVTMMDLLVKRKKIKVFKD